MMRRLGTLLAQLFVRLRYLVVLAWIAGAVLMAVALPSIQGRGTTSFAALVPPDSAAITAQKISAERFKFPLLSQTIVVVHDARGIPAARQLFLVKLAARLSGGRVPGFRLIAGALPLLNTLGAPPFARQRGTTALLYLYFHSSTDTYTSTRAAQRLVRTVIGHRPGEFEGVTGAVPAQTQQTSLIQDRLIWVELATILLVAIAIAVHFRAPGAALLTIVAVGLAYVVSDRVVAQFGSSAHLTIPAEAQPVLVVLVFGIVTDYSIFFMSRFRTLLIEGVPRREAGIVVMREIAPIVFVAGLTVALGTAALLAATMAFLRGFGPGLAIAVAVSMAVAVTFVPSVLAVAGTAVYWPRKLSRPQRPEGGVPAWGGRVMTVRMAVRHPILATLLVLALVGGAASGVSRIAIGNELIAGLPASSPVHRSYTYAERGFAPGVTAPAVVVITGLDVGANRTALWRLQGLLSRQAGVVAVIGPRQQPLSRRLGFAISRDGTAARFVLFLRHDPLGARSISDIRSLQDRLPALLSRSGFHLAHGAVAGDTAISADIVHGTLNSLWRVIPAVLGVVLIVIAIFLRALVAPLYLVLTSLLAVVASLGLTVYVMQILAGYGQVPYYVLFTVGVMLISLGSDYNVFVVGRIWQEGRRRPLREAIEVGGSRAARPIATAGFVLALSFALLAIVPLRAFREIAFGMGVGLLIDAFIVRAILVPALMSLFGARSAWPGHALRGGRRRRISPAQWPAAQED